MAQISPWKHPYIKSPKLRLWLTFCLSVWLVGCSINAREYGYEAFRASKAAVSKWPTQPPNSARSILLATYASSRYERVNTLPYDAELVSGNTPVLVAWMEFKEGEGTLPLYRYIVLPIKAITAEELLKQGAYVTDSPSRDGLPAKMPATVTKGAIVTDWQFCYDCFAAVSIEDASPVTIASFKKKLDKKIGKSFRALAFINKPEDAFYNKKIPRKVYSGEEALRQHALIAQAIENKAGEIASAKGYDQKYRDFIDNEFSPLIPGGLLRKAGCPTGFADLRSLKGDSRSRANQTIRHNSRFLDCVNQKLANYDINPYAEQWEALRDKEKELWMLSTREEYRWVPRSPKRVLDGLDRDMQRAMDDIDSAYNQLRVLDEQAVKKQQAENWSRQQWANTFNNIKAANDKVATRNRPTQQIIREASKPKPNRSNRGGRYNSQAAQQRAQQPASSAQQSAPATTASAEAKASTSESATAVTTGQTQTSPGASSTTQDKAEKTNSFVGAGRDYAMTGDSGTYLTKDVAINLAKTSLKNRATKFCGGIQSKVHITWADAPNCKKSKSANEYYCSYDANINCYENRCAQAFCGTAEP